MNNIGKNIKALRIGKNMTQDELAARLYVTRQTVSNYETGKSKPDISTLLRIAEVLEADIHAILYEPQDSSDRNRRYLRIAGVISVLVLLGFSLYLLNSYAVSHNQSPASEFLIFVQLILQPGYYFLMGWQITASLCALHIGPLFSRCVRRTLQGCVTVLGITLIIILFPYYSVMLSSFGIPYIRVPSLWLSVTHFITRNLHFIWISLLLGVLWGLGSPFSHSNKQSSKK